MCQFAGKTFDEGLKMGWLACAIESEGSLQLTWGKRPKSLQIFPRVNLCNQDSGYIEKAVSISQELGFDGYVNSDSECKYLTWIGFKRVKRLLSSILPYLCIERKKEIAKCILDFVQYREKVNPNNSPRGEPYGEYEKNLFFRVRELNGKGRIQKQLLKFAFEKSSKESSETIRPTLKSEDIVRSA